MTSAGGTDVVLLVLAATESVGDPDAEATPAPGERADGSDRSTGGAGVRSNHHAVTATSNTAPDVVATRARVTPPRSAPARWRHDRGGGGRSNSATIFLLGALDGCQHG